MSSSVNLLSSYHLSGSSGAGYPQETSRDCLKSLDLSQDPSPGFDKQFLAYIPIHTQVKEVEVCHDDSGS